MVYPQNDILKYNFFYVISPFKSIYGKSIYGSYLEISIAEGKMNSYPASLDQNVLALEEKKTS